MVSKKALKTLTSSKNEHWNTPFDVLIRVRSMAPIGLDPCSNSTSIVNAKKTITLPQDGLAESWEDNGLVFVNPPYGRKIMKWALKAMEESLFGTEIIMLVPARTDTRWWQGCIGRNKGGADAVCFWKGRLTFVGAPAPAPFPSAVVYFGDRPDEFKKAFRDAGWVVTR